MVLHRLISLLAAAVALAGCAAPVPEPVDPYVDASPSVAGELTGDAVTTALASSTGHVVGGGAIPPYGPAGGDLGGTYPNPGVSQLRGNPVTAGTPTTGNTLGWTGSAWAGAAVNLAGGAGYVSGLLPIANLGHGTAGQFPVTNSGATADAFVSMSNDATMTSAGVVTVAGLQGNPVASGALTAGKFYIENAGGTALAGALMSQDCTMTGAGVVTCTQLQGGAVVATTGSALQCAVSSASCGLGFVGGISSSGTVNTLSITGETNSGTGTGGPVVVSAGQGTTGGAISVVGGVSPTTGTGGAASLIGGAATQAGTGTGGAAIVSSGAGTTSPGVVRFQVAGADLARISLPSASESIGEFDIVSGNGLMIGSSSAVLASGTNVFGIATGTTPVSCATSTCLSASGNGLSVMSHDATTTQIGESGIVFGAANANTTITQTAGTTGVSVSTLIVQGQNMTGAAASAGNAMLVGGSATGTTGATAGGTALVLGGAANTTAGNGSGGGVLIETGQSVGSTVGNPNILIETIGGNSGGGANITLQTASGVTAGQGYISFKTGGSETARVNAAEFDVVNGQNVCIGATTQSISNGTNEIAFVTGTPPTSCVQNACVYSTSNGLNTMNASGFNTFIGNGIQFDATQTAAGINQASTSGTQHAFTVSAQANTTVGGTGAQLRLNAGADTTTGGIGGNAVFNAGAGGTVGGGGSDQFNIAGTTVEEINPNGTNTASWETGFVNGSNVTIGSLAGSQASGTNIFAMVHGSQVAGCNYDVCFEVTNTAPAGLATVTGGGMYQVLVPEITGTHNSQANLVYRAIFQKRTTGVSQTVALAVAVMSGIGAQIEATCIARTVTAGTTGSIGDMGKNHVEGLVKTLSGTTSLVGSTTAVSAQADTSAPIASCVISGNASSQAVVTGTSAANGAGLVLDWEIFVTAAED